LEAAGSRSREAKRRKAVREAAKQDKARPGRWPRKPQACGAAKGDRREAEGGAQGLPERPKRCPYGIFVFLFQFEKIKQ